MKKTSLLFSILTIVLFCFSCSKDDDAPSTIPIVQDDSFFKAKIDGVEYIANGNQAVANITDGGDLFITSVIPDGQNFYIGLAVPSSSTLNTITYSYPYPVGETYFMLMEYSDGSNLFGTGFCGASNNGELKITSLTEEEISGTFSFYAGIEGCATSITKTITEGSFKLKIN